MKHLQIIYHKSEECQTDFPEGTFVIIIIQTNVSWGYIKHRVLNKQLMSSKLLKYQIM